jgi:hypothetical protein
MLTFCKPHVISSPSGRKFCVIARMAHRSGWACTLCPFVSQHPQRFVVLGRDITDSLNTRQQQAAVQGLLAKVFLSVPIAIAIWDAGSHPAMVGAVANAATNNYKPCHKSSCHRFVAVEAYCKSVAIGTVFHPVRQMDGRTVQSLQGFEHGAIVLAKQSSRYMQPVIGVNANQIRIEGSMVDFGKRNPIGDYRLTEPLILRQYAPRPAIAVRADLTEHTARCMQ